MNRGLLLLVAILIALAVAAVLVWESFRTPEVEPQPVPPSPEESQPPEPVSPATPAPSRAALPITGLVLGKDLKPLSGLSVCCGDETALTDAEGRFELPKSLRPRASKVRLLKGSQELCAWDDLTTGDAEPAAPAPPAPPGEADAVSPAPASLPVEEDPRLPATLQRVRWTFNLIDGASQDPWFALGLVLAEDWGSCSRLRARGRTKLPDGAQVSSSLYFDGFRFIASAPSKVQGGSFGTTMFCPQDVNFYSATYEIHVSYYALLQMEEAREEWKKARPEIDWDKLDALDAKWNIFVGDFAEALKEDREVEAYYGSVLDQAKQLERELKWRVEEVLDLRGWDPALLRKLFAAGRFEDLVKGNKNWDPSLLESRGKARDGWFYSGVVEKGEFQEAVWRKFLDEEWRPKVVALRDRHAARTQEKYGEAGTRMAGLLKALLDESYIFSRFVVYPTYLKPHPNDFIADEDKVGDLSRLENMLQDHFTNLERFRHITKP